jgi:tripartite-type tricarboxylate transporter receptor subunit TctC
MTTTRIARRGLGRMAGAGLATLAAPVLAAPLRAQPAYWPSRPLRWIVPYPAGGGTDLVARSVAAAMAPALGQPVVVDNRPGAAGILAAEALARAPADGHTLMSADMGMLVYNTALYRRLPYDPARDFRPVSTIARFHFALVAYPEAPVRSVEDLVVWARRHAGALTMASPGIGSPHHLALERLQKVAGIRVTHLPYRGGAPAVADLVAGRVQAMFLDLASGRSALEAGRLRALAVPAATRLPAWPGVPTLAECGFPGFEVYSRQGVLFPAGTPDPAVEALSAVIRVAAAGPALVARLAEVGVEAGASTPGDYAELLRQEGEVWLPLIRDLGISIDA